ncbi:MAG: universal stress protein [SAR202 cluster bacterium]|nr:universal stress protein [SAR202 cluster bacterium]
MSGLTRWVLGSVTEKVVRSSGNPVIILPGVAQDEAGE